MSVKNTCSCGKELNSKCRKCKECSRESMKLRRESMLSSGMSRQDVYNYAWRLNNPEKYMLHTAKSRAKKKGTEFNLTPDDIKIPEVCPVFGTPFTHELKTGKNPLAPSLDRIDPNKGYVKGNVQVISWRANDLKSNGTVEEFKMLLEFLNAKKRSI